MQPMEGENGVGHAEERFVLKLFIAGESPKSFQTISNLRHICSKALAGRWDLEVVDLYLHPEQAKAHQILAVPCVIRQLPPPIRKIIGDLSNEERVLIGLNLRQA